jgi:prepilin-type N-terminal cleavage/methylation domain-containing protein
MKRYRANSGISAVPPSAGFTLLELVVAVVVFGILCSLTAVSWTSFSQYQRLRADANAFHKDLMAIKARAIANGSDTRVVLTAKGYNVEVSAMHNDTGAVVWPSTPSRAVSFSAGVKASTNESVGANTYPPLLDAIPLMPPPYNTITAPGNNHWRTDTINVRPDNLDAFMYGRVVLSDKGGNQFCIQKDSTSIKPELYFRKGAGGKWKRL